MANSIKEKEAYISQIKKQLASEEDMGEFFDNDVSNLEQHLIDDKWALEQWKGDRDWAKAQGKAEGGIKDKIKTRKPK